jgi:hypothetical protein
MAAVVTVNDVLDGHVGLDIECLDRLYLNGYVPNLQVAGQVVRFMRDHLGLPIPSPAIMEKIGTRFRREVAGFAQAHGVPVVMFKKGDRKQDVMAPHLARQAATGIAGVAGIGVAQEYQNVFAATERTDHGGVWFTFHKADRRVTCYYLYLWDEQFGPAFVKICAYFPYPVKLRNGSTVTSGPSSRPARPGSGLASCPTGSPPVTTLPGCRRSATGSARVTSTRSSTDG